MQMRGAICCFSFSPLQVKVWCRDIHRKFQHHSLLGSIATVFKKLKVQTATFTKIQGQVLNLVLTSNCQVFVCLFLLSPKMCTLSFCYLTSNPLCLVVILRKETTSVPQSKIHSPSYRAQTIQSRIVWNFRINYSHH